MFKKITALLLILITVLCFMCACDEEKKPTPTFIPVGTESGNEMDITAAGFDIDRVKPGDKISVFTVVEADIKKAEDGSLASATVKFTGSLAVRGSYTVTGENATADFVVLDEYTEYLPYPDGAANELKTIGFTAEKLKDIYGENTSGYAAVVIESYSLTYSVEDGKWHAFADGFSKDENEYAVMQ